MDLVQQCIKEKKVVYSFVIPNKLAEEFEKVVRQGKRTESEVIVNFMRDWVKKQSLAE